MSTAQLPITTVINVSVSQPGRGLAPFQVNNLAVLTSETPITSVPSGGYFLYQDAASVATDWGVTSETYAASTAIFAQAPNILTGGGQLIVYPTTVGDTLTQSLTKLKAIAYFGGAIITGFQPDNAAYQAAGTWAQANKVFVFMPTSQITDLTTGGLGPLITAAGETYARVLYYGVQDPAVSTIAASARRYSAAYAGRALSCDFSGTNTTFTMHLKDLATILPDSTVSDTTHFAQAQSAGVDVYASVVGVPKLMTSGANGFFDDVYNLNWYSNALQVAGFNALATTSTKIPQTEAGMNFLKRQYRDVSNQATRNGFVAPGQWTATIPFGDPETFLRNISSFGYYVYSVPVSQQSPADRAARKAPLIQIAIKFAGAVHSSNILVNINA